MPSDASVAAVAIFNDRYDVRSLCICCQLSALRQVRLQPEVFCPRTPCQCMDVSLEFLDTYSHTQIKKKRDLLRNDVLSKAWTPSRDSPLSRCT